MRSIVLALVLAAFATSTAIARGAPVTVDRHAGTAPVRFVAALPARPDCRATPLDPTCAAPTSAARVLTASVRSPSTTDLGTLGGPYSAATAMNELGQVTGGLAPGRRCP